MTLFACTSAVDALLFPSLEEGFGLPVVEAMACGCPVITSNVSCLPETAGGAGLMVDPMDAADIAEKVNDLMSDPKLRDSLITAGFARAKEFVPKRTARELIEVYENCLSSRGARI